MYCIVILKKVIFTIMIMKGDTMKHYIITLLAIVMSIQAGLAFASTFPITGNIKSNMHEISYTSIAPLPWHGNSGNGPMES